MTRVTMILSLQSSIAHGHIKAVPAGQVSQ